MFSKSFSLFYTVKKDSILYVFTFLCNVSIELPKNKEKFYGIHLRFLRTLESIKNSQESFQAMLNKFHDNKNYIDIFY